MNSFLFDKGEAHIPRQRRLRPNLRLGTFRLARPVCACRNGIRWSCTGHRWINCWNRSTKPVWCGRPSAG
jgi:hypothetical protein